MRVPPPSAEQGDEYADQVILEVVQVVFERLAFESGIEQELDQPCDCQHHQRGCPFRHEQSSQHHHHERDERMYTMHPRLSYRVKLQFRDHFQEVVHAVPASSSCSTT